jgi:hypothetical protein
MRKKERIYKDAAAHGKNSKTHKVGNIPPHLRISPLSNTRFMNSNTCFNIALAIHFVIEILRML